VKDAQLASSSPYVSLCGGTKGAGRPVKGNDNGRWSSDDVVLWLGRRQNGDAVEWWERVDKVEMTFL
jgi:hypothetical protein